MIWSAGEMPSHFLHSRPRGRPTMILAILFLAANSRTPDDHRVCLDSHHLGPHLFGKLQSGGPNAARVGPNRSAYWMSRHE